MKTFYDNMKVVTDDETYTENGMRGYKSTGSNLVDVFFKISSYRSNPSGIKLDFDNLLKAEPYALKFLFYVRDVREGLGERNYFRQVIRHLGATNPNLIIPYLNLIPEYGRWDDLLCLLNTSVNGEVLKIIKNQLDSDITNSELNKPISLLAKWLPSENASNEQTKKYATQVRVYLKMSSKQYRKTLSTLRKYIDVVEVKMSAKDWKDIDYNKVPSNANLKYKNAFLRNDEDRRRTYLESLIKGDKDTHINAKVLMPHEIVHSYVEGYDETLEQLWNNLKPCEGLGSTIVVRDGSGSMTCNIGNTQVTPLDVSTALAIYCSQYLSSDFKDKFITFSHKAKLIDLSNLNHLNTKLKKVYQEDDCEDTNIESVFDLILRTAINSKTKVEDMPKQVLIISDMEFNEAIDDNGIDTLFEQLAKKYKDYGYKLPKLIFWNVDSKTNTIPFKENDNGLLFVSGFSTNVLKMLMSGKTDPRDVLTDILDGDRYKDIKLLEHID